jgi:hypothetical protein
LALLKESAMKKPPKIDYEKEYYLLHRILSALRVSGMSIDSSGSEDAGYIPLNEFQLSTAKLHFGTLADIINEPEKYKDIKVTNPFLDKIVVMKKDVSQKRYTLEEVSVAVETLKGSHDLEVNINIDPASKIVNLTSVGLHSLNEKIYCTGPL